MMRVDDVYGCDIGNGFGYISLLENANSDPKPMFLTNATYQLDMIGKRSKCLMGDRLAINTEENLTSLYTL